MVLSTVVYQNQRNVTVYDPTVDYVFVNLNPILNQSFNNYTSYIAENNLNLKRKEKNKLGIHFILTEIFKICNQTTTSNYFYYQVVDDSALEYTLLKRIFNALPTKIIYDNKTFEEFIKDRPYFTIKTVDNTVLSFAKFRLFLKRYELQQLEQQFKTNVNIKLSLLP